MNVGTSVFHELRKLRFKSNGHILKSLPCALVLSDYSNQKPGSTGYINLLASKRKKSLSILRKIHRLKNCLAFKTAR